jgi:hypothetical protein
MGTSCYKQMTSPKLIEFINIQSNSLIIKSSIVNSLIFKSLIINSQIVKSSIINSSIVNYKPKLNT